MSHIHFIGGEKGGVGKSLVARVLAQHLIDHQIPFVGFDTDRSHGALLRFYGGFAAPVPLDAHDSMDRVLEAAADPAARAEGQARRRVLVDLAAQTQGALTTWLQDAGVPEVAADLGITLQYWHVMDAGRDSVDLLARWLDGAGATLPLVLVLNEVRGAEFDLLQASGLLPRAQAQGAKLLHLRKLPDGLLQKVDAAGASFWAALQPGVLGLLDRQRLKVWLQRSSTDLQGLV